MNDKGFFYADYSVGKVTVASKTVDAGQYTVELLNQYYKDDTVARISKRNISSSESCRPNMIRTFSLRQKNC